MSRSLIITILALIMLTSASCATSRKGGKKHKRPNKGGGKGCDCPSFSQQKENGAILWDSTSYHCA